MWLLPAPAGAISAAARGRGGEHHHHGGGLLGVQAGPGDGLSGASLGDQLRRGLLSGGEDVFFGVEVLQGRVPVFVRGPVDAAAVGGADAEAGYVGDVGGGHADHAGAGAAGHGQFRHLGDHGVGVGAGGQDGQGAVDFEPQLRHRPDGVMLLDFGDGDPRRPLLGRVVEDGRHPVSVAGRVGGYLLVYLRQRLDFPAGGLGFPRGQPLGVGGFGAAGLPGQGAAGGVLAAAGVLPGLLVQQPQRAPARRAAVAGLVLVGQPLQFPGDRDGAGAEGVDDVLADAADLGAVPVGAGHHHVPQAGQLCLHQPVGGGGDGEPLVVQRPGVQGAPFPVGTVGALDPVPDRHVHVQLRVSVAADVMQEQRGGQAVAVAPLPRRGGVVAGAGVGRLAFEPADRFACRLDQRVLDLLRLRVQRGGLVLVAAVAGLPGGGPVGGVQH